MNEPMNTEKHPAPDTGWFASFLAADGKTVISAFTDSCIGVSTTTETHVMRLSDGQVEARVGFSVMGPPNMNEAQFAACGHNPFHPEFHDNYASAKAATVDEALKQLSLDLKSISDGLWAES